MSEVPTEETAWAQTLITVTPQEDGFLREIEGNCAISGSQDAPLPLDTWNVVLRRSLATNAKHWIDTRELDGLKVEDECQTYLRGVPRVELPLGLKEEATQTLFIGGETLRRKDALRCFDDIIAVLNDKRLPQLKTSRRVQTNITTRDFTSEDDFVNQIQEALESRTDLQSDSETSFEDDVSDLLNFILDRSLWMIAKPEASETSRRDVEVQTAMRCDHRTKRVTIESETQTRLTCEPRASDSVLLLEDNRTREFCRGRVIECLAEGVDSEIFVENVVDGIVSRCEDEGGKKMKVKTVKSCFSEVEEVKKIEGEEEGRKRGKKCSCEGREELDTKKQIMGGLSTEKIVEECFYDKKVELNLERKVERRGLDGSDSTSDYSESRSRSETSSKDDTSTTDTTSSRNLTSSEEQALDTLRRVFCRPDSCSKRYP